MVQGMIDKGVLPGPYFFGGPVLGRVDPDTGRDVHLANVRLVAAETHC